MGWKVGKNMKNGFQDSKFPRLPRWWFQIFFIFTPIWGRWTLFDEHIFQMGWFNHQPVAIFLGMGDSSHLKTIGTPYFMGPYKQTPTDFGLMTLSLIIWKQWELIDPGTNDVWISPLTDPWDWHGIFTDPWMLDEFMVWDGKWIGEYTNQSHGSVMDHVRIYS